MSPELDKQLCDKYPKIFADRYKSPHETCMCWGFEVGDGWYNLIDLLCEALTYTYTTSVEIDEEDGKRLAVEGFPWKDEIQKRYFFKVNSPQVVASQVKDKFGTLRFYYHLEYDPQNLELVESGKYPELGKINERYANYIDGIVHFAETASARFCSVSGLPGELHVRGGWLKTISKEVAKDEQHKGYKLYAAKVKEETHII